MEIMRPANGIDQKRLSPAPSRWGDPASTMRVLKPLTCRGASEARHRWQGGAYSPPPPLSKEERTTSYPSFPQIQTALDTAGRHLVCPNSAASLSFSLSCARSAMSVYAELSAIHSGPSKAPTPSQGPLCESLRWDEARRHVRERPGQRLQKTRQHLECV